jgi:hypothetical protein
VIGESGLHRGRDAKRLMHPTVVVMHEVKGNHYPMVLNLFAEYVRQTGKPTHGHSFFPNGK